MRLFWKLGHRCEKVWQNNIKMKPRESPDAAGHRSRCCFADLFSYGGMFYLFFNTTKLWRLTLNRHCGVSEMHGWRVGLRSFDRQGPGAVYETNDHRWKHWLLRVKPETTTPIFNLLTYWEFAQTQSIFSHIWYFYECQWTLEVTKQTSSQ